MPTRYYPPEHPPPNTDHVRYYPPSTPSGPFGGHPTLAIDLISRWSLDEAGGVRLDSIGSNDLTDNNTVLSAAGIHNDAASFLAANSEYLSHVDDPSLRVGTSDFAFALWYQPVAAVFGLVLAKGAQEDYTFDNYAGGTGLRFYTKNGGGYPTATWGSALTLGQMYFVVGWRSGNDINLQVDDGAIVTATAVTVDSDTAGSFTIGAAQGGGNSTTCLVDEVLFRKGSVFTTQERTDLWNGGAGLFWDD